MWTETELVVLDRCRAALGVALSGLERSPWLPDALRTAAYAIVGGELGARLPHALAAATLVGLGVGLARARGASIVGAILAGAFVLAFPVVQVGGRTLLGNPVGELAGVLTVVIGLGALQRGGLVPRIVLAALGLGVLLASVASTGLLLGATLPLCVLAVLATDENRTAAAAVLGAAALTTAVATLVLVVGQGDGYIPILGAAKDPVIADRPETQPFTAALEALGIQVFPWLPLAIVGVIDSRRDRWPALWLLLGLVATSAWALVYGQFAVPLTVPVALCCAHGIDYLARAGEPRSGRRLALVLVLGGMLIMGKDATRTPGRVASSLLAGADKERFPAEDVGAEEVLARMNRLGMLAVLLVYLLAPGATSRPKRRIHIPQRIRRVLVPALVGGALAHQALAHGHVLVPRTSRELSPRAMLARHSAWVEAGQLPERLLAYRVRDAGVDYYGPPDDWIENLDRRLPLIERLSGDDPVAALVSASELPRIHRQHRFNDWPLFVLDASHSQLMLLANVLPEGATDQNPITDVLRTEPVPMTHETLVEFGGRVQIIGWEIEEPVIRGRERTLKVLFRVLKSLPGGVRFWIRLQNERISRVTADWHEPTDGIYPPNFWREGDYVIHEYRFDMPTLEILPGEYDIVCALRRTKDVKYDITIPEGKSGEFGVHVRDKKRHHATIGHVWIW
jgi:hypothetical protein